MHDFLLLVASDLSLISSSRPKIKTIWDEDILT